MPMEGADVLMNGERCQKKLGGMGANEWWSKEGVLVRCTQGQGLLPRKLLLFVQAFRCRCLPLPSVGSSSCIHPESSFS